MFGTAIRYIGRKPKPKMKPIELKTPPEQTQTITRTIFDILKEHGPLNIADTWERLKAVTNSSRCWKYMLHAKRKLTANLTGCWFERLDKQKAHEDSFKMDEGKTKA